MEIFDNLATKVGWNAIDVNSMLPSTNIHHQRQIKTKVSEIREKSLLKFKFTSISCKGCQTLLPQHRVYGKWPQVVCSIT